VGDWISKYLKTVRARFAYRLAVELFSLLFALVFFKYALDITLNTDEQTTAFAMSKKWLYVCMPITGGIMVLYSIKNMVLELAKVANPKLDLEPGREDQNH
jgi:TRAP-type C4-dicarboxylate transport system permease small subunit